MQLMVNFILVLGLITSSRAFAACGPELESGPVIRLLSTLTHEGPGLLVWKRVGEHNVLAAVDLQGNRRIFAPSTSPAVLSGARPPSRVRIMPAGRGGMDSKQILSTDTGSTYLVLTTFDGYAIEVNRVKQGVHDNLARWKTGLSRGDVSYGFVSGGRMYVAWAGVIGGEIKMNISDPEAASQPLFSFSPDHIGEVLIAAAFKPLDGDKGLLALQTGKKIYVLSVEQLRSGTQQSRVEQGQ